MLGLCLLWFVNCKVTVTEQNVSFLRQKLTLAAYWDPGYKGLHVCSGKHL